MFDREIQFRTVFLAAAAGFGLASKYTSNERWQIGLALGFGLIGLLYDLGVFSVKRGDDLP